MAKSVKKTHSLALVVHVNIIFKSILSVERTTDLQSVKTKVIERALAYFYH